MSIYTKLEALQITLPPVAAPAAAYVPFVQTGNLVFLSGHIAKKDGKPWVGQLGKNMTTAEGQAAARAIAIDLMGTLHAACGDLNRVKRIVKVMSLVNSDIALGADFVRTMQGLFFSVQGASPKHGGGDNMLVIGRRTDVNLPTPRIDFDATDWSATLRNLAMEQGHLHSEYGIDYLVTTRPGIWARPHASAADDPAGSAHDQLLETTLFADDQRPAIEMPPFLVGVYRWDSFALARAILSPAIAVIDATAAVTAVHLQQASAGEPPKHRGRRGASYSDRLVHNTIGKRYLMGRTVNADYELTAGGELLARVSPLAM